jgi:hypothetical protein
MRHLRRDERVFVNWSTNMEGLAELYPTEIAHEPRQVPRLHRVVTEGRMGIEVLATVVAEPFSPMEAVASTISQLRKALHDGHATISFEPPQRYPGIPLLKVFWFLGILTLIGLFYGYNIEVYQRTFVKGVDFSFSLKFTKPQQ